MSLELAAPGNPVGQPGVGRRSLGRLTLSHSMTQVDSQTDGRMERRF
jgi:hypothetical protein